MINAGPLTNNPFAMNRMGGKAKPRQFADNNSPAMTSPMNAGPTAPSMPGATPVSSPGFVGPMTNGPESIKPGISAGPSAPPNMNISTPQIPVANKTPLSSPTGTIYAGPTQGSMGWRADILRNSGWSMPSGYMEDTGPMSFSPGTTDAQKQSIQKFEDDKNLYSSWLNREDRNAVSNPFGYDNQQAVGKKLGWIK